MSRWLVGSSSSSTSGCETSAFASSVRRRQPPDSSLTAPVGRQAEPRDHELDLLLDPPAVLALELLLQPASAASASASCGCSATRDGRVVIAATSAPSAPRPSAISSNTVALALPGAGTS